MVVVCGDARYWFLSFVLTSYAVMQGLDESSTSVQRKRGGEDETEGCEELKRPRIMVEESELTKRIKKYLEENKSQKFIDIEKLTLSLHATYPDYGRRKQGVFKTQVLLYFRSQLCSYF